MTSARRVLLVLLAVMAFALSAQGQAGPQPCATNPDGAPPFAGDANRIDVLILGDGYAFGDCAQFYADANRLIDSLTLASVYPGRAGDAAPYPQYRSFFRFVRYLEPSLDSGANALQCNDSPANDPAHPQQRRRTTYSATFCSTGTQRQVIEPMDYSTNPPRRTWDNLENRADAIMPGAEAVLLLVNDTYFGGAARGIGARFAAISNTPAQATIFDRGGQEHIIQHELGHALFGLRDEYDGVVVGPQGCCVEGSTNAPCEPNVTNVVEGFGQPWRVKWSPWYGQGDGAHVVTNPPKTGADGLLCLFRPAATCRMRDASSFDPVCRQAVIKKIWERTRFIEAVSPIPPQGTNGTIQGTVGVRQTFAIQTAGAREYEVVWKVDGQEQAATGTSMDFTPQESGVYTINAFVKDATTWVKEYAGRKEETRGWKMVVPAEVELASSGTEQQRIDINVKVPANTTVVTLDYAITSQEPGDRPQGDPWHILVAFANSTAEPLFDLDGEARSPDQAAPQRLTKQITASNVDRTVVLTVLVKNGEQTDFRPTTVKAAVSVQSNCGVGCDPCKADPPGPGCPVPVGVNQAKLKKFTDYRDEFYYHTEFNPVHENYISIPENEWFEHHRFLWVDLALPKTWTSLRAVAIALDANGNELHTARNVEATRSLDVNHPFGQESRFPYWWRLRLTPDDFFYPDPKPPYVPDERKTHAVQYRVRFFVTIPDGRVGETEMIVSLLDPAESSPKPLLALWNAPMPLSRFYNDDDPDTHYLSAGAYKWLQQNETNAARLPQGSKAFGQISGQHALAFNGCSPTGTDIEVNLWHPYTFSRSDVVSAFDPAKPAARENLIKAIAAARGRVYELINGDNFVAQVRIPGGAACSSIFCQDSLPNGYFESLLHTGRMVDLKNRVLDLTTDARIGTAPWIINTNRIVFDTWRSDFELILDRCRLGEFGPIYCGTGRPPGTGKNMRIVTQPAGATILPGGFTNLSVFAEGPDLLYRWYAGVAGDFSQSTAVEGGTTRQITVYPSATTTYWVYVWNNTGNEKSNGATVIVCTPASISTPPQSQTIDYGSGATLSVAGDGTAPLSYRWLDASGAAIGSGQSIFISSKQTGTYTAEVTNACGVARANATITVRPCLPPILNFQSAQTITLNPGMSTTLQVIATGSPDLRYRWYANGADTGVTTSSYPVTPAVTTTYHAIVTNDCGTVQSYTITVNVCVAPSISAQPEPKNIIRGQSAPLSVGVGGSTPMSIVWTAADGTFAGNGASISVTPNVTTTYKVRLSNACGALDSNPVTVTVCIPPSVGDQPQSKTIALGETTTLSVTAAGDAPLSYQWFRDDVAIQGSISPTLTITPTTTATYRVAVTNACSTTSSVTATITVVCTPPTIKQPPQSVSILEGDGTTLTVVAEGSTPLFYQWYEGNTLMIGETDSSLFVAPIEPMSYSVKVTNSCGSVISDPATVSISPRCFRPFITAQPQPATIAAGQSVDLFVTNTGTAPFSYQWFANGTAIGGAIHATYTASPTATTSYHVVITNCSNFTATSQPATITVQACDAPSISVPPQSAVIQSGQSAPLSVTAGGTAPLSYQWYANGSPVSGAMTASYNASPTVSTTYHVTVSNACGAATSSSAIVTVGVCDAPSISVPPQSVDLIYGQQTTLRVTASGTAPLSYQWYANGSPVTGANGAAYTVTPTATTNYYVVVSNGCGTATSSTAVVTVSCVAPVMGLQPKSATIEPGQSVELTTTSSGLQPFTWQWYANGSPVPFSNGSALTVSPSTTTSYYVVVSNACGSVTSATATVTVLSCIPARVTDGPDDVTIAPGGSTTLSVQTTGSQPRTYEWRTASGTLISTTSSVTVSPSATTTYTVQVSNACGSDTDTVQVSVVDCPPPIITFQPKSIEVWESNHVVLEVVASSPTPLTYQWYANGVLMQGRTSRAIDVSPATVTTSYYVKVTNACGTVQSDTAVITVKPCTKPQITTQPQDVTIVDGESATFSAVASGTGPMTYQLIQQDMTDGGSNTTGVFTVKPPIVAPAIWWYFISVTNGCGFTSTRQVTVTILSACTPPSITTQPQSVTINSGQSATLTVAAGGSTPQTVQWFTAAGAEAGTGTSLTVSPASTTSYYARVSNSCGTQQSATATVTVTEPCTPPAITSPSADAFVFLRFGNTKTLTVVATGTNLQYQWFKRYPITSGFVAIPLANGASLAVSPDDDTDYRLRITNSCGEILSPLFKVRMWEGPEDPPGGGGDPI